MKVTCFWCKEKHDKSLMYCEATATGKYNKNGTEKMRRRYFHYACHTEYLNDKEKKQKELEEFDKLYNYLLKIHNLEVLNTRMIGKLQDFRNGSISIKGRKIKKYKKGISFQLMLDSYKHAEGKIEYALNNVTFQNKWNEFSYIFAIMVNNVNEVVQVIKHQEKVKIDKKPIRNISDYEVPIKQKKKDELDISEFL